MDFEIWYSLRFLVRRHLRELLEVGFTEIESQGAGWLAGSGFMVLHCGDVWIRIVRHMFEESVELAFSGPPQESDWFGIVEVLMATGLHLDATPGKPVIPHRLREKAAALTFHLPRIERALRQDRSLFLSRIGEIREEGIRQGAAYFHALRTKSQQSNS